MNTVVQNGELRETDPWKLCMDNGDIFLKSLEFGRIRGIAALLSGVAPVAELIPLAQELIKRDILVVLAGRAADDVERAEKKNPALFEQVDSGLLDLCEFIGIHPVVYMNLETDASNMRNFYMQQAELATVGIGELPLTEMAWTSAPNPGGDQELVYGRIIRMNSDPMDNADLLEDYIHEKRLAQDWCDRYYCDEVAYS
ncbi:hypothetical protein P4C99_07555 [Pontiellaceae bacterium B1224]|nr:hypothetical protein [Pontiellaceae bacterium B1224]